MNGFQKPQAAVGTAKPRIPVVQIDGDRPTCSCGWVGKAASRVKVAEDRMERHVNAKHGGRAIWR